MGIAESGAVVSLAGEQKLQAICANRVNLIASGHEVILCPDAMDILNDPRSRTQRPSLYDPHLFESQAISLV